MAKKSQDDLLTTLGDFTSKENWDNFFSIRGTDDSFEWYAEWDQLRDPLVSQLRPEGSGSSADEVHILVPGCGNSLLSEHLYDEGFMSITNIDFSKVVVSDMLRRNVRSRPGMRWRLMDMTDMQFADDTFDAVLDKGGLDALMEPELGSSLGNQYLSEVKRVLKKGGKFVCLTLAESHVLGLFFPSFRHGWKTSLHLLPQKISSKSSLRTFMVISEKVNSTLLQRISPSFDQSLLDCSGDQAGGLFEALEIENRIRTEHPCNLDISNVLEDLRLGIKEGLSRLSPGRRVHLTLGETGHSRFFYQTVILDAQQQDAQFSYFCGVFLVPKTRAHEWLFSSEEGQWMVVESSKAARLIMVFLDSSHSSAGMDDIQKDLSPLVKQLAPGEANNKTQIPFMAAGDGIKQRKVVHQVTSPLTGPVVVDDVVYEKADGDFCSQYPSKDHLFRRLTFERSGGLVQSEALLNSESSSKVVSEKVQKKSRSSSKSKKKGCQRRNDSHVSLSDDGSKVVEVDHGYIASSYHTGIVSGFVLISSYLERISSSGRTVRAVVIGLGAGLLPMFFHQCIPSLNIEAVELDPVVHDVAKEYFGLREDERLKVHITDGIQFVQEFANVKAAKRVPASDGNEVSNGSFRDLEEGKERDSIDILIVDVDSSDSSSGLRCPAPGFVESSFFSTVRSSLSDHGLFIINLVSRSQTVRDMVLSRMKMVFSNLFSLRLEEDVNEVIFAVNTKVDMDFDLPEAAIRLEKLLKLKHTEASQTIISGIKKIKPLE